MTLGGDRQNRFSRNKSAILGRWHCFLLLECPISETKNDWHLLPKKISFKDLACIDFIPKANDVTSECYVSDSRLAWSTSLGVESSLDCEHD